MGYQEFVEKAVEIFDKGGFSCDAAREVIATARKEAFRCTKNEEEAIGSIRDFRCGRCLKKKEADERFYSVRAISEDKMGQNDIMNHGKEVLASDQLCKECFDIVINRWFKEETAGKRERQYIEDCERESRIDIAEENTMAITGEQMFYSKSDAGCKEKLGL